MNDQVRKTHKDFFEIPQIALKVFLLREMLIDFCLVHHASCQGLVKGRESNGIILHGLEDHSAGPEDYDRPEGGVFLGAYYDFIAAFSGPSAE